MTMDTKRYAGGQTWDDFVASAQEYQDLWRLGVKRVDVPDRILASARDLPFPVHVAVLNEDWCLDAAATVPAIVRLAEIAPSMDVRIFGRDDNPDLMDAHLTNGGRSIPVAMFYDADFRERAWWGPRPRALQEWVVSIGRTLPKNEKYQYIRQWYARDKGRTTLEEVSSLLREYLAGGDSTPVV